MDDETFRSDLDDIECLLPPHTTEYRSGSVPGPFHAPYEEPATIPELPAVRPD